MEMPTPRLRPGTSAAHYLFLLLASGSLCLGLCSGFLLLRSRNNAAVSPPQPYVATATDLDAEKLAQRRNVAELLGEAPLPKALPSAAPGIPLPAPAEQKSSGNSSELPKNTEPKTAPLPSQNRPGQNAKPTLTKTFPPGLPAASLGPIGSPSEIVPELSRMQFEMRNLANQMAAATNANKLLFNYLADEIATAHVEMRNFGSRIAVVEYAIQQVQEKGLSFWVDMLGTLALILQSSVGLYNIVRGKEPKQ